jgi:hypothetical protein
MVHDPIAYKDQEQIWTKSGFFLWSNYKGIVSGGQGGGAVTYKLRLQLYVAKIA